MNVSEIIDSQEKDFSIFLHNMGVIIAKLNIKLSEQEDLNEKVRVRLFSISQKESELNGKLKEAEANLTIAQAKLDSSFDKEKESEFIRAGAIANTTDAHMTITTTGNVGIGTTSPTAVLHLAAGTATASTAPLKFTSGTLLTTPEAGAMEFLTDSYYGTITTNAVRRMFVMGTSGRVAAQTAANASVATYTLGATDATFEISAL